MSDNAPITLRITPSLKLRLIKIANREDRSVSATIRRSIKEYVEKAEKRYGISYDISPNGEIQDKM